MAAVPARSNPLFSLEVVIVAGCLIALVSFGVRSTAGLFTAPLAEAVGQTGSVLSVEGAPGTSRDARKNLHEAPQVEIVQGRVERVLRVQLPRAACGRRPSGCTERARGSVDGLSACDGPWGK